MYSKPKTNQDPLVLLQKDLNQIAFAKYKKTKQNKINEKKKQKQASNISADMLDTKLPSIYGDTSTPFIKGSNNTNANRNYLMQKIKQFQNKVFDLQTQNALQKRQNQKLMDNVIKLRTNHKSLHQSVRYPQPQYMFQQPPMIPQYLPFPYQQQQQQQMVMPQMMPYQNMNNINPTPSYQPQSNLRSNQQLPKGKSYKKKRKISLMSNFRVAGYVVFFSLFLKKYSKTFTLNRFDEFKQNWMHFQSIKNAREKLGDYFLQKIGLNIFERKQINDLDSLRNIETQKQKKEKKNPNNKKNSKQNSDSSDSSDFQSQSQKLSVANGLDPKNSIDQSKVFQFFLKIDIAVNFVIQFIKQISKTVMSEEFQQKNPFLILLLSRQFQPDRLHDQEYLKYLKLHEQKGYSQNQKLLSQILIIKNIYLNIFVDNSLLSQFAKRFYIDSKKQKEVNENKIFFSFFIRTSIFRSMLEQYLNKKLLKCQIFSIPKQELIPFKRLTTIQDPLKQKAVSFEQNGIDMKHQNIYQISKQEMKKRQKEIKNILDSNSQKVIKKLFQLRKKQYQSVKEKTLSGKYRTQQNSYFKLHEKNEHQQQKTKKLMKTTQSFMQQSSILHSTISRSQIKLKPHPKSNQSLSNKTNNNNFKKAKSEKSEKSEKREKQKNKKAPKQSKKKITQISQSSSEED